MISDVMDMKTLKLTVRPETFEEVINGRSVYTREIRPETQEIYCEVDDDGYVKDVDGVLQPRKYDAIQFVSFCNSYTCKIIESHIELFEDQNGELVEYVENGEEYLAAQIVYELGDSLDNNNPKGYICDGILN